MATEAGVAYVTVKYDPASINKLRRETATHGRNIGSTLGSAGARAGRLLAVGIGAGAVAAGYGLVKAVEAAGNFQKQLNVLQAVSGATADQMTRIQAESIALGKDLSLPATSAQDAALAMTELAKGGLSVRDSMQAAKGTLQLAAAGQVDVGTAATVTATALNQFSLAGSSATHVADLLAGAANASAGDVSDFTQGLQYAGTAAHAAGQSIDLTIAALAEMANKGLSGSVAGTALAQSLRSLQSPSAAAADEMHRLGLNIYDAQGNMKPLDEIAQVFTSHLGDMTQKQQNATLATIFGSRAVQAARIVFLGGRDALDKYRDTVSKSGNAQRLAEAQMKGFSGALQGFTSNIETLGIQLGLVLLPAATRVIGVLNELVGVIGQVAGGGQSISKLLFGGLEQATSGLSKQGAHGIQLPVTVNKQGLVKQLSTAIREAVASIPWASVGHTIADNFAAGLTFTTEQASRFVSSITKGILANRDQIAEAGVAIALAMGSAATDPGVWKDNWRSILAIGIVVFSGGVGEFAGVGLRIGRTILRPIGRVFARILPNIAQDGVFAVETLFRTGFRRIGARILATLRGSATRFPTFFNRAFVAVENIGTRIVRDLGARIVATFRSTFSRAENSGEQAMNSIGRAIIRAVARVGRFFIEFTLVRSAIDGIVGAFQAVIDKIREAIGWVADLASSIANIRPPSLGDLNPFRAAGGPVTAGQTYIVGERQPELFVPRTNGMILPNANLAGAGPIQVNVMISQREIAGIAEVQIMRGNKQTARNVQAGSKW